MQRRRVGLAVTGIVAWSVAMGCDSPPRTPTTPSPPPIPSTAPTPPTAPPPAFDATLSSASVVIEDAFVRVHSNRNRFDYGVRFLLRETGGRSGATVSGVTIVGPEGSDITGPSCWRETIRVPPGATIDLFHTDAGQQHLLYCAPTSGGVTSRPNLTVEVSFSDDDGKSSTVATGVETFR